MTEPVPAENENVPETPHIWQYQPDEPELPGRAVMIVVALSIVVLAAAMVTAVLLFIAA